MTVGIHSSYLRRSSPFNRSSPSGEALMPLTQAAVQIAAAAVLLHEGVEGSE